MNKIEIFTYLAIARLLGLAADFMDNIYFLANNCRRLEHIKDAMHSYEFVELEPRTKFANNMFCFVCLIAYAYHKTSNDDSFDCTEILKSALTRLEFIWSDPNYRPGFFERRFIKLLKHESII